MKYSMTDITKGDDICEIAESHHFKRAVLRSLIIEMETDHDADISHLGEYSTEWQEGAINRKERGDLLPNECMFFIPANPEHAEEDYHRAECLYTNQWCFLGIKAKALVYIINKYDRSAQVLELESPGIWGIESDSGEEYLTEACYDQLQELCSVLEILNVIIDDKAFKEVNIIIDGTVQETKEYNPKELMK